MKLIRYAYPDKAYNHDLEPWFDNAFEAFANALGYRPTRRHANPPVDLYDDKDNYYVRFEIPGVKKEDLTVEIENALLTLKGTYKNGEKTLSFSRSVSVPEGSLKASAATAALDNGILTVTLPKSAESKPRTIAVN